MDYKEEDYWSDRANKMYRYKGEEFYTITPIPYYYRRRKVILSFLKKCILESKAGCVCDYGCGDGEYLRLLASHIGKKKANNRLIEWGGVDISAEMLKQARHNCKMIDGIDLNISGDGIPGTKYYEVIYSVAVFAHIDDKLTERLFRNFNDRLSEEGRLVLCEQVGARRVEGKTYTRRTVDEYKVMLRKAGFVIKEIKLIDFWAHRIFFERRLAKWFYQRMQGATYHDRQIEANKHLAFKICSTFFACLSKPHIFKNGSGWGYIFIVAEKRS